MIKTLIEGIVSIVKLVIVLGVIIYAFESGIVDNIVSYFK
jgi:hypothetical protein